MAGLADPQGSYGIQPPSFRLPNSTHLGGVHLQVSDVQRSVAYYEQVIGLRAFDRAATTATLGVVGDEQALVTLETRPGVTRGRRGTFGLYHFALLLPDRAALGRFAAHLARLHEHVGMADHLVSEALYLWDPDGLGIEVYADRPRARWRQRNGELQMTTDPLDIANVIAEGGGVPWDRAPAATTMGHIHLHVGNLDGAETFYHRAVGFDKTVWSYPGALFLSAGGYHHHLGTNIWAPGPAASEQQARLLGWELILPAAADIAAAAQSIRHSPYAVYETDGDAVAVDPWGTRLRLRTATSCYKPGGGSMF